MAHYLPHIVVEVAISEGTAALDLTLDSGLVGKLDINTLAAGAVYTDISGYVRSFSVGRGRNRATEAYRPGVAEIVLDNTDGRFDPENLSGPYVSGGETNVLPMVPIRVSATWSGSTYPLFQGFVDEWTCQYPGMFDSIAIVRATDAFKVLAKYQSSAALATTQGVGESTGDRISRILDFWNWANSETDIEDGLGTCQGTVQEAPALSEMQLTADSEYGDLFMSADGKVTFRQRYSRVTAPRSADVQVSFSDVRADVEAGTAIGYTDIERVGDADLIRNDVTRAIEGGTPQTASDAVSIGRYQRFSDVKTDLVTDSDQQALIVAQWILSLYSNYEQRVASLTVVPASAPTYAWPLMLATSLLDRVSVTRTPPFGGSITSQSFVQGINWTGDGENWVVKLQLESATYQSNLFILDHISLGLLNSGGTLGV